jgi:hypothetical protein
MQRAPALVLVVALPQLRSEQHHEQMEPSAVLHWRGLCLQFVALRTDHEVTVL